MKKIIRVFLAGVAALFAAALAVLLALMIWPKERAIDLVYVVPDDFRGEFILYLHDPSGKESRPKGGRLVLDFTTSKPVAVSGADPLRGWCRREAFFANGERLEIFRSVETYPSGRVLLDHDPPLSGEATVSHIFVGTEEEIRDARESRLKKRLGVPISG